MDLLRDFWHLLSSKFFALIVPTGTIGAGITTFLSTLNPILSMIAVCAGIYGTVNIARYHVQKRQIELEQLEHDRILRAKELDSLK